MPVLIRPLGSKNGILAPLFTLKSLIASACELALDLANPATVAVLAEAPSAVLVPLTAGGAARAGAATVGLGANIAAHDLGAAFTGAGVGSAWTSGDASAAAFSAAGLVACSADTASLTCSPPDFSVLTAVFVSLGLPFGNTGTIGTAGTAVAVLEDDLAACVGVTLATVDVCVVWTEAGVVGEVDCALSEGKSWVDGVSGRSADTAEGVAASSAGVGCVGVAETAGPAD